MPATLFTVPVVPAALAATCMLSACGTAPAQAIFVDDGTVLRARPIVPAVSTPSDAVDGRVFVAVIGDGLGPGEPGGMSYTVRRASDGAQIEVAQPAVPAIAVGARVRIVQDPLVRLVPN